MKLYIAGPMSGCPQSNFPAFDAAAADLRSKGYEIVSPAELDDPETRHAAMNDLPTKQSWGDFLARDVKIVADDVDGIVLLPGWFESRGAKLEAYVGLLSKKEFYAYRGLYYPMAKKSPKTIMDYIHVYTEAESL